MTDEERFNQIERKLDQILISIEKSETLLTKMADQVKPVLDELMKSSLLKIIGMGGKK